MRAKPADCTRHRGAPNQPDNQNLPPPETDALRRRNGRNILSYKLYTPAVLRLLASGPDQARRNHFIHRTRHPADDKQQHFVHLALRRRYQVALLTVNTVIYACKSGLTRTTTRHIRRPVVISSSAEFTLGEVFRSRAIRY